MISDEQFMRRAFELAQLGIGHVSPNPLVGCVIVHQDRIVGEGWHQLYGESHAEVNAVKSVADKSTLKDSVVYVNLEPCAHTGKTPPCADLLIEHNVKRVVISNEDPNPLVQGMGVRLLKQTNIELTLGVCEKEGRLLNRRFFKFIEAQHPYVILKWAQTADGFIAKENNDSKWISNEFSRQLVHKWRAEEDAVLVGFNTAFNDNPQLSVRDWQGRNPVRIVVDNQLQLNQSNHLFDRSQTTICYNSIKNINDNNLIFVRLYEKNWVRQLLSDLYKRNIQSVIIEGGSKTINYFIKSGYWDEARIFTSTKIFERGIAAPEIQGELISTELIQDDELSIRIKKPAIV